MSQCFVLLGSNDRKIMLENATHPCPRCKRSNSVQLTRYENELIIFNKRIPMPNNMDVRYECKRCNWKNQSLPDDDPSFRAAKEIDYFATTDYLFVNPKRFSSSSSSSLDDKISSVSLPINNNNAAWRGDRKRTSCV